MRYETLDMNEDHYADLTTEIERAWRKKARLVAIIDEEAGGIIAYALGEDFAADLVHAANAATNAKHQIKPSQDALDAKADLDAADARKAPYEGLRKKQP